MKTIPRNVRLEVILSPSDLQYNVNNILMKKIKSKMLDNAFEQYGIVKKIDNIDRIFHQQITENSMAILTVVDVTLYSYLPKVGDVISYPIKKIFNYGIYFVDAELRILIPLSTLPENFHLQKQDQDYYLSNESKTIRSNDVVELEIVDVRFEKNGFSCIAKLLQNDIKKSHE